MNLIHKMLRYGAIWLVSPFFQFWSFFFLGWAATDGLFQAWSWSDFLVTNAQSRERVGGIYMMVCVHKMGGYGAIWLILFFFPYFGPFTCSFSSNDAAKWQESSSKFSKMSIHRLCQGSDDQGTGAKELLIHCLNSSSSAIPYNGCAMTFSTLSFN